MSENRNVLTESARIARGNVKDLKELADNSSEYNMLLLPGGFGAAKNLSTFATQGANLTVNPELEKVLVVGACCIAPVVVAKVYGNNVKITLGKKAKEGKDNGYPYQQAIEVAETFGAKHVNKSNIYACVDKKYKVVTAPAFMKDKSKFTDVYTGIANMVENCTLLRMRKKAAKKLIDEKKNLKKLSKKEKKTE